MSVLQSISTHRDLLRLNDQDREILCREIREFLVAHIAQTGGHLASNLGVVELTVALETVFDTDKDRLVFDVGHQSYVHKLLTGRQADFERLRQLGGLAGFPRPDESDSDAFIAGHASSAVSIALGMARARTLSGADYRVVALLGDGAATGGMAFEGLNDAAVSKEPLLIILNDNEMSIDRNVGGVAKHLSRLRSTEQYLGMKRRYANAMEKLPGGKFIYKVTRSIKDWLKRSLIPTTIFENMGLTYLGPVDGHNLPELIALLRIARDMDKPVLLHVLTQKGRGYAPAEEDPARFHGIGKFDPTSGRALSAPEFTFSDAFGQTMLSLAGQDARVCAITAAMPGGTGLLGFKERFPKRMFDVGIAEEHAISMAGGLAKQGMIPVAAIYSTFLQRAYDMLLQDVCILKLHVVLAVDRAGLVGEDGQTHQGIFDVGFLRQMPGMQILCPASCAELADMLRWAVLEQCAPVAIRYPRGGDRMLTASDWGSGMVVRHESGADAALVAYGVTACNAIDASQLLARQGIRAAVLRLLSVAPLPIDELLEALADTADVIVVEECASGSGIREALAWEMAQRGCRSRVHGIDLGKGFATHGSTEALYRLYGLDADSIARFTREVLGR